MKELLRLNRYLASAGVASRRKCDELIRSGRVAVNGTSVTALGTRVSPDGDIVSFDGHEVHLPDTQWTLVLNKPTEVLVAAQDARGRRTVMDLLRDVPERVFPVGRLDYRSQGLLLFTSDGDLAYRLAHPRFKVEKVYVVEVVGSVSPAVVEAFRRGVVLEDGRTQPARTQVLSKGKGRTLLEMELREGRKRQIRRMLALYGHEVSRLHRIRFGPIEIEDLSEGRWRELTTEEVARLRDAVGLSAPGDGSAPS